MIKAVLFDMDGLLVDSETLAMKVVIKVCAELGIPLLDGQEKNVVGVTAEHFFQSLVGNNAAALQEALSKFTEVYEQLIKTELVVFDGAKTLPAELKAKGLRIALVSGSTPTQIDIILSQLGAKDVFEVIISEKDITHSKPNPEGYLLAAKKIGVSHDECVVIEDAEAGVAAGKAAGMKVIGVHNMGGQDLSDADAVYGTLAKLTPEAIFAILPTD